MKSRARADRPEDVDKYLVEAEFALAREDVNTAREVLNKGVKAHPENDPLRQALIRVATTDGKISDAVKLILAMLEDTPDESDLLFQLAELRIQEGEPGKVDPLLAKLKEQNYPPTRVAYLKARVHLLRQEWGKAGALLEQNRQEWGDQPRMEAQVGLLLGQCYEQLGNPDQALSMYQQALKAEPASIAARRAVAAALLSLGRSDEALAEYRQLLRFGRRPLDSRILVARLLIARTLRLPAETKRDWTEAKAELALATQELGAMDKEKVDAALLGAPECGSVPAECRRGPAGRSQADRHGACQIAAGDKGPPRAGRVLAGARHPGRAGQKAGGGTANAGQGGKGIGDRKGCPGGCRPCDRPAPGPLFLPGPPS